MPGPNIIAAARHVVLGTPNQNIKASSVPDVAVASVGSGVGSVTPANYYNWDFTGVTAATGLHGWSDVYEGTWSYQTGSAPAANIWSVEDNGGTNMLRVYQTSGGYDWYNYDDEDASAYSIVKLRVNIDTEANDSGRTVRFHIEKSGTDYVIMTVFGTGVVQVAHYSGGNQTPINEAGLNAGAAVTVCLYIDGSDVYMKAKNGFDSLDVDTWDGSDSPTISGNFAKVWDPSPSSWFIKHGNDTTPAIHGWIRQFELWTA